MNQLFAAELRSFGGPNNSQPKTLDYCVLDNEQEAQWDAVASVRVITSLLSILGSLSIVISAIAKKQVSSPKVHPIFVLSIADLLLAVLWVVGGSLWLSEAGSVQQPGGCLTVSVLTVILELVAINLTLVYACFAHAHIKQITLNTFVRMHRVDERRVCHPGVVITAYLVAWILPMVLILIPFGVMAGCTTLISQRNCSCWCAPMFSNVLPTAPDVEQTTKYVHSLRELATLYTVCIALHYLLVFPLLVLIYSRVIRHIRKMRSGHLDLHPNVNYGATEAQLVKTHKQAKQRVVLFLTVFILTGFCNLVLALLLVYHFANQFSKENPKENPKALPHKIPTFVFIIILIQSVTVPLQGFLNAIVYGWTRDNFLVVMASRSSRSTKQQPLDQSGEASDLEDSGPMLNSDYQDLRQQRQRTPELFSGTF